jgi:hypothetical protein
VSRYLVSASLHWDKDGRCDLQEPARFFHIEEKLGGAHVQQDLNRVHESNDDISVLLSATGAAEALTRAIALFDDHEKGAHCHHCGTHRLRQDAEWRMHRWSRP